MTEEGQTLFIDGGSSDVKALFQYRLEPLMKYYGPVSYTHLDVYKRQVYVGMDCSIDFRGINEYSGGI